MCIEKIREWMSKIKLSCLWYATNETNFIENHNNCAWLCVSFGQSAAHIWLKCLVTLNEVWNGHIAADSWHMTHRPPVFFKLISMNHWNVKRFKFFVHFTFEWNWMRQEMKHLKWDRADRILTRRALSKRDMDGDHMTRNKTIPIKQTISIVVNRKFHMHRW